MRQLGLVKEEWQIVDHEHMKKCSRFWKLILCLGKTYPGFAHGPTSSSNGELLSLVYSMSKLEDHQEVATVAVG